MNPDIPYSTSGLREALWLDEMIDGRAGSYRITLLEKKSRVTGPQGQTASVCTRTSVDGDGHLSQALLCEDVSQMPEGNVKLQENIPSLIDSVNGQIKELLQSTTQVFGRQYAEYNPPFLRDERLEMTRVETLQELKTRIEADGGTFTLYVKDPNNEFEIHIRRLVSDAEKNRFDTRLRAVYSRP
jgi:hypothetical protein